MQATLFAQEDIVEWLLDAEISGQKSHTDNVSSREFAVKSCKVLYVNYY